MTEWTDGDFIGNALVLYGVALVAIVGAGVTVGLAIGLGIRVFHIAAGG